jgi:hypothetical protein
MFLFANMGRDNHRFDAQKILKVAFPLPIPHDAKVTIAFSSTPPWSDVDLFCEDPCDGASGVVHRCEIDRDSANYITRLPLWLQGTILICRMQ